MNTNTLNVRFEINIKTYNFTRIAQEPGYPIVYIRKQICTYCVCRLQKKKAYSDVFYENVA